MARGASRVTVPATSANLGPGFDSLGLALDLRDELEGELVGSGLVVEVTGAGAGVGTRSTRTTSWSARCARRSTPLGGQPTGLRLTCRNAIPHARGLGSSSAAIVGGLVLARALVDGGAAAARRRGAARRWPSRWRATPTTSPRRCTAASSSRAATTAARCYAVGAPVDARVSAALFVPPEPLSTEVARGLLPAARSRTPTRPRTPAKAALLVAALGSRPDQLWRATRDYLHQDYRRPAMPASLDLVDRLRADGLAAVVSGAGPTVLALVVDGRRSRGVLPRGLGAPPARRGHPRRRGRVTAGGLVHSWCAGSRRGTASEVLSNLFHLALTPAASSGQVCRRSEGTT